MLNKNIAPLPDRGDPAQGRVRDWFMELGSSIWLPLYLSIGSGVHHLAVYCALAPTEYRSRALSGPSWDLHIGDGQPGFSQAYDNAGGSITIYERFGSDPVEPLVFVRTFHGVRADYSELSQEFCLFHNLYAEATARQLLKIDDAGTTSVAAHVDDRDVRVLTSLVRQYQAARQLDLLLFIDSGNEYDPSLTVPAEQEWRDDLLNASLGGGDVLGKPFTRFLATRVLPAPPMEHSGVWPFEREDDHFPEFIIGITDLGEPIRFTCEPDRLANYFGKNPDAPHYLTPVHFRREVLAKYYDRPDLYTVEDGYLRCGGLWGLRMDNDGPDTVVVFLGDLGRDLTQTERDYWRSFNVPPARPISESTFRRSFLAQFADAASSDHRFRIAYRDLQETWRRRFGWALYLDPQPGDAHLLDLVRRPLHDTDVELEEIVRTLTKLLVDSLNEAELVRALPPGLGGEKGISKFERWLQASQYPHVTRDIAVLRNMQAVRSEGAAHRKGSKYEKTLDKAFGTKRKAAAAEMLLEQCVTLVDGLTSFAQETPEATVGRARAEDSPEPA